MTACVPVTKLVRENAPSAMRLLVPAIITAFIWLKKCGTLFFVYISKIGLPLQAPRAVTLSTQQTNKQTLWELTELKTPHFCSLAKCALFEEKQQRNITKKTILLLILFSQWFILMNLIRKRCQFEASQINNNFETFIDKWRQKKVKTSSYHEFLSNF